MASDPTLVEYLLDQMRDAGHLVSRKMFGEYAIYCNDKVVALVCDNQLFVKPTPKGKVHLEVVVESPPYPGAKPYFLIEDRLDDREWITALIKITAEELPDPKQKTGSPRRIAPRTAHRVSPPSPKKSTVG
jgi:TfoX/Sxy family transcriptional regulator of competence genes